MTEFDRQIILDTETTGLEPAMNHRVIEIGGVEVINRRLTRVHFHRYLQPDREIDQGAFEVHGISAEMLADKPRFEDVVEEFLAFVNGAELIIHNAPFDVAFLDHELALSGRQKKIADYCQITDSLALARKRFPGQRNNLDALCKRMDIDNSRRQLHGALLDAEILAEVYLQMTGGQSALGLDMETAQAGMSGTDGMVRRRPPGVPTLPVIRADKAEQQAHELWLERLDASSESGCVWRVLSA